ncbi:MAG: hypothetical protein E7384_03005 [Ruminococcaceae bacterium]|nr:hypothetical protein [Oscillospiraceae bacterium]
MKKNNIYIRGITVLLSIFMLFSAVPVTYANDTENGYCEIEHPEYIKEHEGCLPIVEGDALYEETALLAYTGYAETENILPLSWSTEGEYDVFTAEEKADCEALYKGLLEMSPKITLPNRVTTTVLAKLFKKVIYSSPELFYAESSYGYSYTTIGGVKYVVSVNPRYTMTKSDADVAMKYVETEIEKISKNCDKSWSDIEKVMFFHDYLVLHFEYDRRLYTQGSDYVNYDIYNFLKDGTGVCMAYELLYMSLLDTAGIDSSYAENGGHIWNVVKINNQWYHVDATWDDPIVNQTEYNGFHGLVEHASFMKSDNYFAANGYSAWSCDYKCTDTAYDENSVINNAYSEFVIADEGWYYIDKENAKLMLYHIDTNTSETLASISPSLSTCYASVYKYGDYVIYNGVYSIFAYDTVNKTTKTLKTKAASSGYILGFTVKDKVVDYIVGTNFTESAWIHETYSLRDSDMSIMSLVDLTLLSVNKEKGYLENVTATTNTMSEIKDSFANNSADIKVSDAEGNEITSSTAKVGTGCTVTFSHNGTEPETITVVIDCDVDGDGYVTVADALCTMKHVSFVSVLSGSYKYAADYGHNETISVIDVMNILNHI